MECDNYHDHTEKQERWYDKADNNRGCTIYRRMGMGSMANQLERNDTNQNKACLQFLKSMNVGKSNQKDKRER